MGAWQCRRFGQWPPGRAAPCAVRIGTAHSHVKARRILRAVCPRGGSHDRENSVGGRRCRRRHRVHGAGDGAGNQAHLGRPELADRLGSGARALSLDQAGRGGHQGPRQDRGFSVADADQGHRHVEGHQQRHRRHRLVRAGLLARADAAVGRDVAAVPADQDGRAGQRSALEAVREISRRSRRSTARSSRWCCTPHRRTS